MTTILYATGVVRKYPKTKPLPSGVGRSEPFCVISLHGEDGLLYARGECTRCRKPIYQAELIRRVWGGDEIFHEVCYSEELADQTSPYYKDPND